MPDPVRVILRAHNGSNVEEHICKDMPMGWRDMSGNWTFDFKNFGYNFKHALNGLRFVKDDANFIRKYLDLFGISANIDFTVQLRQNNWTFKDSFHGKIDFPKKLINQEAFIEVGVLEGGVKAAMLKDGKTNYDMPFDNDAVDIEVTEGMMLSEDARYTIDGNFIEKQEPVGNNLIKLYNILNLNFISGKILSKNIIFQTQDNSDGFVPFLKTIPDRIDSYELEINISAIFKFTTFFVSDKYPLHIYLSKRDSGGSIMPYSQIKVFYVTDLNFISPNAYEGEIKLDFKQLITMPKNDIREYFLQIDFVADLSHHVFDFLDIGNISFEFSNTNTGAFNFKAYKAEKFGQKLLNRIFPNADFQIPFLQAMEQNENMQLFITSADAIRGIQATTEQPQGALIKTNLNAFLEELNKQYCTAEKVNNTDSKYHIVKKWDVFDQNKEILNLGKVNNMQIMQLDLEWFTNNIQVGYEKQEYDYTLGRQEFAVTLEFNNDINILQQKLDLVSKYRADYTGVHLLHFDYVNSDKKDSKSDNDVFWILAFKSPIIETKSMLSGITGTVTRVYVSAGQEISGSTLTGLFELYDGTFYLNISNIGLGDIKITEVNVSTGQSITPDTILCSYTPIGQYKYEAKQGDRITNIAGMEDGGYFNILLSPKTMLMNHSRFFASMLDKHEKILRYTSSTETMSALEYDDTTLGHVVEKADLSVVNAVPFFKPIVFEFDALVGNNLPEILGQNPAGYFKFRYNNLELKGFPIEVEGSITRSEQIVKCIAHPDILDNIQEILHKRLPNKLYK
jgi:hypothetical protein